MVKKLYEWLVSKLYNWQQSFRDSFAKNIFQKAFRWNPMHVLNLMNLTSKKNISANFVWSDLVLFGYAGKWWYFGIGDRAQTKINFFNHLFGRTMRWESFQMKKFIQRKGRKWEKFAVTSVKRTNAWRHKVNCWLTRDNQIKRIN